MAKVLTAISRDSPASPLSVNVSDTFSFAGTPTLTGGGGVQRYDFRWEVDPGSGYVPISGSTGLTTANTNPLVNTNSQSQNSITVTCAEAGSYTIRMAGAPTSGGSYTVFSATQTVEVALAGVTGTMAAQESGADSAAASGSVAVSGSLAVSESGSDTFAGNGSVQSDSVTGTMAATESGSDAASVSGTVAVNGSWSAIESGGDTASFAGMTLLRGLLAASETGSDAASLSGTVAISGSMALVEVGADDFTGSGPVIRKKRRLGLRPGIRTLGRL